MSLVDLDALPDVKLVPTDIVEIIDRLVSQYELESGTTLPKEAVARICLSVWGSSEQLQRIDLNEAGKQTLIAFAASTMLDHIGALSDVARLTATPAVCTMQVVYSSPLVADYTIPAGRQIQTTDGSYIFETDDTIVLSIGDTSGTVTATCTTTGTGPNDIAIGDVSVLLDDLARAPESFSNTDITSGGGTSESDDRFRERIRDANSKTSTAGSIDSYNFYAKTANSSIVDTNTYSPSPGQVEIAVLLENGGIPGAAVLAQVEAACNPDDVRPLTDTVTAVAATEIIKDIVLSFDYYSSYSELTNTIKEQIENDVNEWADIMRGILGRDIVLNQVVRICMNIAGVYNVNIIEPADQVLSESEFFNVRDVVVTVGTEREG